MHKKVYPMVFLIVPLVIFGVFFILPSTFGYLYAFTDWSQYVSKPSFVGLSNFRDVIENKTLSIAFVNTILFALVKTVVVTVLGFILALAVNRKFRSRNAIRTVYFIPAIFSALIVGLIFAGLFDARSGVVNRIIIAAQLKPQAWFGSRWSALFVIELAELWRSLGYAMVITLAGLQSVDASYLEAATVDGASPWQKFRHITLPLIMPSVNVNILFSLIYGLKMFDLIYVTTMGGPGHDTESLGTLVMSEMASGRFSHSVAINLVFTLFLILVAYLYNKMSKRWDSPI